MENTLSAVHITEEPTRFSWSLGKFEPLFKKDVFYILSTSRARLSTMQTTAYRTDLHHA